MTTPRKKKQFTVSNYGSFTEEIKWSWAPVSKTETEDGHVILRFDGTEVTRDVYMKTVETLMGLFPELPSILEFTNCDAEGVRMSKLAYSLLKITSYAQYLTPANLQAVSPPRLTNVPQFPHIIRLFLIDQPEERPFAMDCFVRVLRTWMAFGADDLYYVSAIDYEKASYSDRNKIFSKIPDILDMFLMVFREDVCEFLSFVGMNAVGASILYNFLFLTEIDMFHRFFLSEIRAYLSYCESDEADNNKSAITARHLSFLILVESLESASHDTNGYAYMTSGDNKECCVKLMALKVQFFAFICDPLMDPNVAVMLMCLLTSSKMHPDRNAAMLRFAADMKLRVSPPITLEASSSTDAAPPIKIAVPLSRIYNEGQLSLRRVRANFFARDSVTGSPIEYLDSIKTTPKKARTPRKPNLHTLHLFISSLEACLYPSATMKLEALPLASMYAKTNKVFPFVARVKGVKSIDDVFFYATPL